MYKTVYIFTVSQRLLSPHRNVFCSFHGPAAVSVLFHITTELLLLPTRFWSLNFIASQLLLAQLPLSLQCRFVRTKHSTRDHEMRLWHVVQLITNGPFLACQSQRPFVWLQSSQWQLRTPVCQPTYLASKRRRVFKFAATLHAKKQTSFSGGAVSRLPQVADYFQPVGEVLETPVECHFLHFPFVQFC